MATGAFGAPPYFVEFFDGGVEDGGVVGEDACPEVAAERGFHAHACAGEVGASDVGNPGVDEDDFEMYAGA